MTLILDNILIPEKGTLEIKVDRTVEINVTAEQARKKVDHWLMDQVSFLMGAEPPTLVIGERAVWRVPAYISFPSVGRAGTIGTIDVDAQTGEMSNTPEKKAEIKRRGEEIARKLPPFKPLELSPEYKAKLANIPPAPEPKHSKLSSDPAIEE